ncbi:MAG: hypothetical protein IKD16_01665 [Bacteroidales bacterium]|nr:hypothetical protein [Bacteroidales bacterium]
MKTAANAVVNAAAAASAYFVAKTLPGASEWGFRSLLSALRGMNESRIYPFIPTVLLLFPFPRGLFTAHALQR